MPLPTPNQANELSSAANPKFSRPTGPFLTDEIVDRSYGIIPLRLTSSHASARPSQNNTEVLLIHQKARGGTRFWGLPKGHAEKCDGSELESAVRELREETGLVVGESDFLRAGKVDDGNGESDGSDKGFWTVKERYWQPDLKGWKEVKFFAALVGDQNEVCVQEKEVAGAQWCGWDRALELVTFVESEGTLRACLKMWEEE